MQTLKQINHYFKKSPHPKLHNSEHQQKHQEITETNTKL